MRYHPDKHHRHSIRLKGHDYSQAGAYFVTICTQDRECLFGHVVGGEMRLTETGRMVRAEWQRLGARFPNVELDVFVVMPNHLHGIVVLTAVGAGLSRPCGSRAGGIRAPRPTLGQVVAYFKYQSTKRVNAACGTPGTRLWQRNYYEHIIRSEDSLNRIREYIANNPRDWELDPENPGGIVGADPRSATSGNEPWRV